MDLQTAKIVSAPNKDCWSQIYIDNSFLVVIKIEKEDNPSLRAKEVLSCFYESYADFKGGALKKLEASLKKVKEEFVSLKLTVVVGVTFKDALYLGILNRGRVVLFREGSLATILEGKEGVVIASGFLKNEDLLILGTEKFFSLFLLQISEVDLEKDSPEEILEALAPVIHEKEKDGSSAAVIAKVENLCAIQTQKMVVSAGNKNRKEKKEKNLLVKQVLGKTKSWLISLFSKTKPIYVSEEEKGKERKQRMMLTIAVVLAVLLLVSIVFGWQKRKRDEETGSFNQFWEEIEYKYEQGNELVELNPIRARELFGESLALLRERKDSFLPKNWQYKKLEEKEKEIEKELEKVLREYELVSVPVFLDLDLVKKDLKGIDYDFWEKKIIVLGEDGTVITIDLNKKTETLGKVAGVRLVTFWGGRAFVLGEEIVEIGKETQMIEKGGQETIGFKIFTGNFYLLDKGENKIFKIPAIESGFGAKRNWFGSEVETDLSEAVDMAIDGDIWILLKKGKILKFSRGTPKGFGISGLDKEWDNPTAFYTDKDCKKIYILDKENRRVLVLNKSGEYDSQYIWDGAKDMDDIIVSEEEKKIFLLSEEKIFEIEIR